MGAEGLELGEDIECNVAEALLDYDLPLHIASVFILLIVSLLGAIAPIIYASFGKKDLAKQPYNSTPKFLLRLGLLFGAGVILATGFIHMLVPGFFLLNNPCLNEAFHDEYPAFAALFAMFAILLMQLLQYLISSYYAAQRDKRTFVDADKSHNVVEVAQEDHHPVGKAESLSETEDFASRKQLSVILLESGIAIHSVIIGFALGVATGSDFIALLIALCFHQFFEGLALGSTVVEAEFASKLKGFLTATIYGLTTPLGIIIGIAVRSSYAENSPGGILTQGILESFSAGVLIYTALVEFLNPQITNSLPFRQQSLGRQAAQFAALYLGVAIMSIIGLWA